MTMINKPDPINRPLIDCSLNYTIDAQTKSKKVIKRRKKNRNPKTHR
jgi:hypothetical protein